MRIALDLDNVVVDILHSARRTAAAIAGVPPEEVLDTHAYHAPFGHDDPEVAARLVTDHDFWQQEPVLAGAVPLRGAVGAVWRLHRAGVLAGFVTRRPGRAKGITRAWMEIHDLPPVQTHHVGHLEAARNHELCKADVCIAIGATHLVDDSQGEVERAIAKGIAGILVDHPLGRPARDEWRATRPDVPVVPDVTAAVDLLLGGPSR